MVLSRFLSLFSRLSPSKSGGTAASADAHGERAIALRHHRFKLFLTAWNKFQETMTDVEYSLCCDHPFGMYRVRAQCTRVATQVFQCIQQLEHLEPSAGGPRAAALQERFAALQAEVAAMVYPQGNCLLGASVVPLGQADAASPLTGLADPALLRLDTLRSIFPDHIPQGFILTEAGCHRILQANGLQEELNRRLQAGGGLTPDVLPDLAERLGALVEQATVPEDVQQALFAEVRRLRAFYARRPMRLLLRGRLWPEEQQGDASGIAQGDHGLLLWGPTLSLYEASDEDILAALLNTLAHKHHAQALIYRRYRGLTDDGAGICIGVLCVEEGCWGGVVHTGNPMQPTRGSVHVYACRGLPQDMEHSRLPVDVAHVSRRAPHAIRVRNLHNPDLPVLDDDTACRVAALALAVEEHEGCPQTLTWVCTPEGQLRILLARPLITAPLLPPETLASVDDEELPPPLISGGITAAPGIACGPVFVVRSWEDALDFPVGGVLVVEKDLYQWVALMDRAAAVITEEGILASRLGSLAREFGKPAIFGMPGATRKLAVQDKVTVYGDATLIFPGCVAPLLELAPPPRDFMPGSPVYRILQHAAEHILPLTLDPDSPDFKAANCSTYHDIARYCHEKAVSAMFAFGSDHTNAPARVKQLQDQDGTLKQFWMVNLDDGFEGNAPHSPVIPLQHIVSRPMLDLWQGMNAYPWEGPPPVDSKGFMSVLFEATANPHLDPAAQTAYFSEKNYFLVTRDYCSLHSRFGFHFVSVEARLGPRTAENYVVFQLRGGAANIERRILRVRFVADLLWEFGFAPAVRNDAVVARAEGMNLEEGRALLAVAGYMTIHTRQLDMIMADPAQVRARHDLMQGHCRNLLIQG